MKSLMMSLLILSFASLANASSKVISHEMVNLPVDLSPAGIKLSFRGYSALTVKILIPELADVTLMNHRNELEGAPCLATFETKDVGDVVQGKPTVEQVPFLITLERKTELASDGVCNVSLVETITGKVRGFTFSHVRASALPERVAEDCR